MKTAVLLFFTFATFSCFFARPKRVVIVRNASHERFDSIVIHINSDKFKLDALDIGQMQQLAFAADSLSTPHDVVYQFQAYRNDSLKAQNFKFMNDLGAVPEKVDATINDTLSFTYDIKW